MLFVEESQRWHCTHSTSPVHICKICSQVMLRTRRSMFAGFKSHEAFACKRASFQEAKRAYASTVGRYTMLLLPDGTISFDGSASFDERDSSQPPALVAIAALALESQQAVCCSNVKLSPARLHSFLSSVPPATVSIVHSKH